MDSYLPIDGAFSLPTTASGERTITIPLQATEEVIGLHLYSNLIGNHDLVVGQPVANITIQSGQESLTFSMRYGMETGDWLMGCPAVAGEQTICRTVFSWHKPIELVGRHAYQGAWSDSTAYIYGTYFTFLDELVPEIIEINYLDDNSIFYVWGSVFELDKKSVGTSQDIYEITSQ